MQSQEEEEMLVTGFLKTRQEKTSEAEAGVSNNEHFLSVGPKQITDVLVPLAPSTAGMLRPGTSAHSSRYQDVALRACTTLYCLLRAQRHHQNGNWSGGYGRRAQRKREQSYKSRAVANKEPLSNATEFKHLVSLG